MSPTWIPSDAQDPAYAEMLRHEAEFWESRPTNQETQESVLSAEMRAQLNERYTGDPSKTWIQDLAARGPFGRVAMLGSTSGYYERQWFEAEGSRELDVYDLAALGERMLTALETLGVRDRVRFHRADLNFIHLPEGGYDMIFAATTLHHLVRLEHLFDQVLRALRPGGLFAFNEYVGPPRVQFEEERLELARQLLPRIPERFRVAPISNVLETDLSPFEARRSDEILPLCREYFEELHVRDALVLAPLWWRIDVPKLIRIRPDLIRNFVIPSELAALKRFPGCTAYAVFRREA